ncbi:MAG: type II toxin-antitoxin system Phd/YefM family antitoxin [Anaerolineae bacterium]|nr:type II toxin-antitoxin system Phd/YefM family antitoxin [Anaerolineae bacterium]
MNTVSIAEIKNTISTLINRVIFGRERVILTSRGKPKAVLVSMEDFKKLESQESAAPSRAQRKAALELARAVREMSLARRGGVPFTNVADDLNRLREERDLELSSVC